MDLGSFVEQLCENKDRPQLNCDGKCYLAKMMQQQSQEQEQSQLPAVDWEELTYIFFFGIIEKDIIDTHARPRSFYVSQLYISPGLTLLGQPPQIN